jgi:prepilin-type N-terminal cleavage/methylation domain-containing protein
LRNRRRSGSSDQRGFTLIELTIVLAVLSILAVMALALYANLQSRARVGKAQADLKGLQWALVAFGAHCGDVPNTPTTFTDVTPLTLASGADTCANAVAGNLAGLGQQVLDANHIPAGPFYTAGGDLTPAKGWTYTYTRTGPGQFTLTASHPNDITTPITVP